MRRPLSAEVKSGASNARAGFRGAILALSIALSLMLTALFADSGRIPTTARAAGPQFAQQTPTAGDDAGDAAADRTAAREKRRQERQAAEATPVPAAAGSNSPAASVAVDLSGGTVKDDYDCIDFATQEDAQAVLDADPSDPFNLDPNGDGVACSLLPTAAQVAAAETGAAAGPAATEEPDQKKRNQKNANQNETQTTNASNQSGQQNSKKNKNKKNDNNVNQNSDVGLTCDDFATQEDAQAALDDDPGMADLLDPNGNGFACESTETGSDLSAKQQKRRDRNAEPTPEPAGGRRNGAKQSAAPPEDLDCIDFEFQEDAQAVFDADPADPNNLDPNGDGFACSSLPSRSTRPTITAVPRTGAGPGAPGAGLLLAGGLATIGGAAGLRRLRRA